MTINNERKMPEKLPVSSPDLIGSMGGNYANDQVRLIVKFDGTLDEARLRRAARLVFDAEPVIGCRFIKGSFRACWQRCDEPELESAFEFRHATPSDNDAGIYDFLLAPLDPFNSPQARVGLFRSSAGSGSGSGDDTLYVRLSHIVADGGAAFDFIRILAGIYRRLGMDPDYRPLSNLHGDRSSFQVLRQASWRKILSSCLHVPMSKSTWNFPKEGSGRESPQLFVRRFGRERASRIKSYARARRVTVGDVLTAACYRALFDVVDPPEGTPLTMLIPVNVRRHIPGGARGGVCSLTAGYFPAITRDRAEAFGRTLAKVHASMESEKRKDGEFGQLFMMEIVFAPGYILPRLLDPFLSSALTMPTFSNFGAIDALTPDFGGAAIRDLMPVGPMVRPPEFVLGSSTFRGELSFTCTVCGTREFRAKVGRFFDALERELPG